MPHVYISCLGADSTPATIPVLCSKHACTELCYFLCQNADFEISLDKVIVYNVCRRIDSARKASTKFRCEFQDLAVQCTYTGYMNVIK